jgi:ABC-type transporter Mla MlaB component
MGVHVATGDEDARNGGCFALPRAGPMPTPAVLAACNEARDRLDAAGHELVPCDVAAVTHPDAGTVDALARLQVSARRRGRRIGLQGASPELRDLLALMGLSEAVPCVPESGLEAVGETE